MLCARMQIGRSDANVNRSYTLQRAQSRCVVRSYSELSEFRHATSRTENRWKDFLLNIRIFMILVNIVLQNPN